jgi:hypothetical protein
MPYLLAMVLVLWAADLTRRLGEGATGLPATIGEAGNSAGRHGRGALAGGVLHYPPGLLCEGLW